MVKCAGCGLSAVTCTETVPTAVRIGKRLNDLIIRFRRPELFRELFRFQVMMKVRAGRIVEFVKQIGERSLIPQRQGDGQLQLIGSGQFARWRQEFDGGRHMAAHGLGW